ncbi:hypothetical protein AAG570_011112 [Ranatra chinensis]|uniref:Endonuclease/exonuclease/phosphatase domain-containing protein n=1 Tax=Ranatra chinensis TaxID=642074 RepID=A0ABD0YJP5_9HEMI
MSLGDFNARVGEEREVPKEIGLIKNTDFSDWHKSKDKVIDHIGKQVLNFCKNWHLVVLNGRAPRDAGGGVTFIGKIGISVIDFARVSLNTIQDISSLEIVPQAFSDHMPVSVTLNDELREGSEEL